MGFEGKWCILMIVLLTEVYCRPQIVEKNAEKSVEYSIIPVQLRLPRWLPRPDLQSPGFYQIFNYSPFPNVIIDQNNIKNKENLETTQSTKENQVVINKIQTNNIINNTESQLFENSQLNIQKPPSLAPYRFHPLLNYIKNGHTIQMDKVIRFRNSDKINDDVTTLILKPVARSVAGADGRAMATPVSKAILRKGTSVDILFEPDAIAIAGPGGIAHAQSDLEISYEDV